MSLIRLKDERWPIRIDDKVTAIWVAEAAPTEPSSALDRLLASIIKRPATADYEGKPWPEYYCFGQGFPS